MSRKKRLWVLAILLISFLQMHGIGLSAMLAPMALAFPETGDAKIQFVGTLPALFVLITIMPAAFLSRKIKHRCLTALGAGIATAFALLGFTFHASVTVLYIWSAILGIGCGFTIAVGALIINDLFDGQDKVLVLGLQSFAVCVGTMLLNFLSGRLSLKEWYYGYLAYLIAILPFLASLFLLKNSQEEAALKKMSLAPGSSEAGKIQAGERTSSVRKGFYAGVVFSVIAAFMNGLLSNILNTNIGLYLTEKSITHITAGTLMSLFLLASGCMGLLVNTVSKKIGLYTLTMGFGIMAAGYILVSTGAMPLILIGGMLSASTISLVMPTVLANAAGCAVKDPETALTLTLMAANLGNFATPVLTEMAGGIFSSGQVIYRFILGFVFALLFAVITDVFIRKTKKRFCA